MRELPRMAIMNMGGNMNIGLAGAEVAGGRADSPIGRCLTPWGTPRNAGHSWRQCPRIRGRLRGAWTQADGSFGHVCLMPCRWWTANGLLARRGRANTRSMSIWGETI